MLGAVWRAAPFKVTDLFYFAMRDGLFIDLATEIQKVVS
jgi:hypothetical protein